MTLPPPKRTAIVCPCVLRTAILWPRVLRTVKQQKPFFAFSLHKVDQMTVCCMHIYNVSCDVFACKIS